MPTIEDELRTVFETYASRDEPTVERRAAVARRIERRRRQRWTAGLLAIVVLSAGAATAVAVGAYGPKRAATRPTAPTVVTTPKFVGPVECDGSSAESVLRALFAALDAGQHIDVATYFVAPIAFNLWLDPTLPSGYITFMPGPGSGTVNLDALQSHLDKLSTSHLHLAVSRFSADGFSDHDYDGGPPGGGQFTFDLSGSPASGSAWGGKGLVDCVTGKLKAVVIEA